MYTKNLLKELDGYVGRVMTEEKLDKLFEKYDWECMGYITHSVDKSEIGKLVYMEGPMDRELDLDVTMIDDEIKLLHLNGYSKQWWDD